MEKKYSSLKAIRKLCIDCSGFYLEEVRNCPCFRNKGAIEKCFLWEYRMGHRPKEKAENRPGKAMRKHCLWCCAKQPKEVKLCTIPECPLYPYRMGKNPGYAKRAEQMKGKMPFLSKKLPLHQWENKRKCHEQGFIPSFKNGK